MNYMYNLSMKHYAAIRKNDAVHYVMFGITSNIY